MLNLFTIWYNTEKHVTLFSKEEKKKGIDNYYRQKANTYKWDIFEKEALIKGTQKKTALRKFNFQRLKNMVRRVTIACETVHIL